MTVEHEQISYVRDFGYVPVAPYEIQTISQGGVVGEWHHRMTLKGAVSLFTKECLPVRWGWLCSLVDSTGRIVLQYYAKHEAVLPAWWGVESTFAMLERIGATNPVDLAIWEVMARERYL